MKDMHLISAALLLGVAGLSTAEASSMNEHSAAHDWSGAYLGFHLGYGWGEADFKDDTYNGGVAPFPVVNWDADANGALMGLQAGYNWQRGSLVWGLEGEVGYLDIDERKLQPGLDPFGDPYDASGTVDSDWYAGLGIRVGYALERTLLYAKLGGVYSRAEVGFIDQCITGSCGTGLIDASQRVGWGYQLGAGLEYALAESWTVKAEYTYMDFGSTTVRGTAEGVGFAGRSFKVDADLVLHSLKVGMNYRF
jgi:outer membrane immunogenic protein